MFTPYPGPYVVRDNDLSNCFEIVSTAAPGPQGRGVFLAFVYPVRADPLKAPTSEEMAVAHATAERFARADKLEAALTELLPYAENDIGRLQGQMVGSLYPGILQAKIDRAKDALNPKEKSGPPSISPTWGRRWPPRSRPPT